MEPYVLVFLFLVRRVLVMVAVAALVVLVHHIVFARRASVVSRLHRVLVLLSEIVAD